MVKSLLSILFAGMLLIGAAVFEGVYVKRQFSAFGEEVAVLIQKTEEGEAGEEDGEAVYVSWERRRDELHIWIPHNDISRIDDYLSESIRCLREHERELALSKLEIVARLCETLPSTYLVSLPNLF